MRSMSALNERLIEFNSNNKKKKILINYDYIYTR